MACCISPELRDDLHSKISMWLGLCHHRSWSWRHYMLASIHARSIQIPETITRPDSDASVRSGRTAKRDCEEEGALLDTHSRPPGG